MAFLYLIVLFALWIVVRRPKLPSLGRILLAITITVAAVCLFRVLDRRLLAKGEQQ